MPGKLSKEELFAKVKSYTTFLNKHLTNKIELSDEQIQKNIDAKYDFYSECVDYLNDFNERNAAGSKYAEGKPHCLSASSSNYVGIQAGDKREYDKMLSQIDTVEKARNYHVKTIEAVTKLDYRKIVEATLDPKKSLQMSKDEPYLTEFGFRMSKNAGGGVYGNTKDGKYLLPEELTFMGLDRKLYENSFSQMRQNITLATNPFSFMYSEMFPPFNQQRCEEIIGVCLTMGQEFGPEFINEATFINGSSIENINGFKVLNENVEKFDIRDATKFKSNDPKISLGDQLMGKCDISPKSKEEIKDLQDVYDKAGPKVDLIKNPKDRKNEILSTRYNREIEYDQIGRASRFFSHFLPNSWTKAGRIRNEIADCKQQMNELKIPEKEYQSYFNQKQQKGLDAQDDLDMKEAVQTERIKNSKDKMREFARDNMIDKETIIDPADMVDTDEDEMEETPVTQEKSETRKQLNLEELEHQNSSSDYIPKANDERENAYVKDVEHSIK